MACQFIMYHFNDHWHSEMKLANLYFLIRINSDKYLIHQMNFICFKLLFFFMQLFLAKPPFLTQEVHFFSWCKESICTYLHTYPISVCPKSICDSSESTLDHHWIHCGVCLCQANQGILLRWS